jgi:NTP pyrophosphatase (non-canonical NTP hydrolase)
LLFCFAVLRLISPSTAINKDYALSASDSDTTVAELRKIVADFVAERDWSQFHSPKNVSMALAIEAAELMEHFQWLSAEASRRLADDPQKLADVGEELADVVGYSFALANELGIDLSRAIRAKMIKNAQKYPADQYRGRYGPEDNG